MNVVGSKWVFRTKFKPDGSVLKHKARLVAKGFHQTAGLDYFDIFSPVVKPSTIRVLFALAVHFGWDIQQVDINNAFLNGDLHEQVFMKQPDGFEDKSRPSHVCKLHKALYGLKQAPRSWFHKLRTALLAWGFHNSTSDSSLFIKKTGANILYLLVYVDDIVISGTSNSLIQQAISYLNDTFALKFLGSVNYFLGFEAFRDSSGLFLTQAKYTVDLLQRTNMFDSKPCENPCSGSKLTLNDGVLLENPTIYRSTIGALQYLCYTRPDIAYSVNKLSQFLVAPTQSHWQACKRVLRYLRGTLHKGLWFKPSSNLSLVAYADADWASCLDDRRSTSGNCVFLGGNLISWSAKKQHVVARSSTEAEYRSMAQITSEIMWLYSLLQELHVLVPKPAIIWCDNIGANSLALNPVFHARTKHIDIDTHFIREKVSSGIVEPRYIPTDFQIADVFIKPLTKDKFHFFCSKLNLVISPSFSLRGNVNDNSQISTSARSTSATSAQLVNFSNKSYDRLNRGTTYQAGLALCTAGIASNQNCVDDHLKLSKSQVGYIKLVRDLNDVAGC